MVNLITTDSYFELFPILTKALKSSANDLSKRNLVFCEAKVSLMAERFICAETGGSFNTEVYSFGKYLRTKKTIDKLLSKEGSSMVVKRILAQIPLKCFKHSKVGLAPSLYELIMQLKSAKVSPENIEEALPYTKSVLKNKLEDIAKVYSEYEKFIIENAYEDQSSALSYLPAIIEDDEQMKNTDVYLLGFGSFTAQARAIVESLIKTAKSVTAILTEGDNFRVFVNETAKFIEDLCLQNGKAYNKTKVKSEYSNAGRIILDNIFAPVPKSNNQTNDAVRLCVAENPAKEAENIASIIKQSVINGECRYRDVTVAIPQTGGYGEFLKSAFNTLDIPFFIDESRKPQNHPLIMLIISYIDAFRKNLERRALTAFFKNPFFTTDKNITDGFENYLIKYNVNYGKIKEPFVFGTANEESQNYEQMQKVIVDVFKTFDVKYMLERLNVKENVAIFTQKLKDISEFEEAAINEQIYDAVINIIEQMELILGGIKMSVFEYKNVFMSGISALELSIIPQYNDAVFVGGYKEVALAKAKYLFAVGLTSEVPDIRQDVAILSDKDIETLEQIKVLIEPKINVINHRTRENTALALCAFSDKIYLSYPTFAIDGSKNLKSEIITTLDKVFSFSPINICQNYLTKKQGLKSFAYDCSRFVEGKIDDFTEASSYFDAVGEEELKDLLNRANKEIKKRLTTFKRPLIEEETSPTTIEDYFKCPYRAFVAHSLRLKEREEGKVDVLSVGNIIHEILSLYALSLDKIDGEQSSDEVFEQIKLKVLEKDEYKKFLSNEETLVTVNRVLRESKKYCYQTYKSFIRSKFKVSHTEVAFGSGANCKYPAVKLLDGQVKIKGKIDRVDECDNYYRILDYKTGSTDASVKSLFSGIKLQLFLYAAAVSGQFEGDNCKIPAGLYYLPVSDKYEKESEKNGALAEGFTLNEQEAINAQDLEAVQYRESAFLPITFDKNGQIKKATDKETLLSMVKYAVMVSENAAKNLKDGVIIPSPYENTCDFCKYKGLCGESEINKRTLGQVKEETLVDAVKGEN